MHRLIVLALLLPSACAVAPGTLDAAVNACNGGAAFAEVRAAGTVMRVLGARESRSGVHEGFFFRSGARALRVEDNAGITGPIPLRPGEPITVQGQYECDDGVIHWTHHDPAGRHTAGFVEAGGRMYF